MYISYKNNMNKKGISLITLIVTIIVIVVLVGAVVLSLVNNSPIGQATFSVDLNNLAAVQEAFEYNKIMSIFNEQYPVSNNVDPIQIDDVTKGYIAESQGLQESWDIDWSKVYYLDPSKLGLKPDIKISTKDPDVDASQLFIVETQGYNLIYNKGVSVEGQKYYSYNIIQSASEKEISSEELLKNRIFTSLDSQTYVVKENGDVYSVGKITSSNLIGQPIDKYKDVENTLVKTNTILNEGDQISIGKNYTFLQRADGKLTAIGSNIYGNLGLGDTIDRYEFVQIGLTDVKQAVASSDTSVFLLNNGDVYASGKNFYEYGTDNNFYMIKEGGAKSYDSPIKVEGISNVDKILFVSDFVVIVKKIDGTIWGWGSDCYGSFGLGTTKATRTPTEFTTLKAIADSKGTTIKDVQTRITTVALLANGEVYTSGFGNYSCLGNGTTSTRSTFTPSPILTNVKEISLGSTWCYAITNSGVAYGWGGNGPIGTTASANGTVIGIKSPSTVPIDNVVKIVDRYAITTDGSAYKLGLNSYNEFNKKYDSTVNIKDVYADMSTSGVYFVDTDNYVWSVGNVNRSMLLGDYGYQIRALKTAFTNVDKIYANSYNILYTTKDNKLYSAGNNSYGSLGIGTDTLTPHAQMPNISGISSINQVAVNTGWSGISYILDSNNRIWNSGANTYGQSVTTTAPMVFTINNKTLPTGTIERIIGKNNNLFVKMTNGKLYGMGYNANGEVGVGNLNQQSNFAEISKDNLGNTINFANVKTITERHSFTYALMNDGKLYSWGINSSGQLGLGTKETKEPLIKEVTWFKNNGITLKDVKTGVNFAVFITETGDVYTVGDNSSGQLGIGNRVSSLVPVKVNIQNVKDVAIGDRYVIAIKEDGSVYSWGKNDYAQCGTRSLDDVLSPTRAVELMK